MCGQGHLCGRTGGTCSCATDDLALIGRSQLLQEGERSASVVPATEDPATVVIEIKGGAIQAIYSDQPDRLKVVVRDWDNIAGGDEDPLNADPALKVLRKTGNEVRF